MTEQERRKGGGSKLSRSETVTVRLDPKLRYLAELAARKQRRTLSSFIEWAIEYAFSGVFLYDARENSTSLADETKELWDVEDPDRFARLALTHPDLLTYDEQIRWKLIQDTGYLWRGRYDKNDKWSWRVNTDSLIYERLREHWNELLGIAKGERTRDILPQVVSKTPPQPTDDDSFVSDGPDDDEYTFPPDPPDHDDDSFVPDGPDDDDIPL